MKTLFLIPARGGSKGIPHKNIKDCAGKPLIQYSIDVARSLTTDDNICVSTDDQQIVNICKKLDLNVPFLRPDELATDKASSQDVILHALNFYEKKSIQYDTVILLQPTSPLRTIQHVMDAIKLYDENLDMVVSVKESSSAVNLCLENNIGFLESALDKNWSRRQDLNKYYEYNGAIYVINALSLRQNGFSKMTRIRKYIMDDTHSFDIDTILDWKIVEMIIRGEK